MSDIQQAQQQRTAADSVEVGRGVVVRRDLALQNAHLVKRHRLAGLTEEAPGESGQVERRRQGLLQPPGERSAFESAFVPCWFRHPVQTRLCAQLLKRRQRGGGGGGIATACLHLSRHRVDGGVQGAQSIVARQRRQRRGQRRSARRRGAAPAADTRPCGRCRARRRAEAGKRRGRHGVHQKGVRKVQGFDRRAPQSSAAGRPSASSPPALTRSQRRDAMGGWNAR